MVTVSVALSFFTWWRRSARFVLLLSLMVSRFDVSALSVRLSDPTVRDFSPSAFRTFLDTVSLAVTRQFTSHTARKLSLPLRPLLGSLGLWIFVTVMVR